MQASSCLDHSVVLRLAIHDSGPAVLLAWQSCGCQSLLNSCYLALLLSWQTLPTVHVLAKVWSSNLHNTSRWLYCVGNPQDDSTVLTISHDDPTLWVISRNDPILLVISRDDPTLLIISRDDSTLLVISQEHPILLIIFQDYPTLLAISWDEPAPLAIFQDNPTLLAIFKYVQTSWQTMYVSLES
jgi:hypothetical protein